MEPRASPFLVTSFVWEPQPGRYALTAVALAAARLSHGREASFIDPAGIEPFYDESQALIGRANLVAPYKPRVDVVVVGHAYAPPGADVDRLLVRVRLGDFSKALSVTGDRLWIREGNRWGSSAPRHFSRMLLTQERALRSAENPVGLDPAAIPVEGRLSLPNFEPAAGSYSAVLGPIPAAAPSRRNVLSPAGAQWLTALELGQRPGPVPEGLNFAFFNVAPLDQQVGDVPAGSAIVLENIHPREPVFTSRLPPVGPAFVAVDPRSSRRLELRARCDTVWVDGDRELAMLVYRATCEIERPDQPFVVGAEIERPPPLPAVPTGGLLITQQGSLQPAAALPFGGRPPHDARGQWAGAPAGVQGPQSWPRHEMAQAYASPNAPAQPIRDEPTNPLASPSSYPPPPPPPGAQMPGPRLPPVAPPPAMHAPPGTATQQISPQMPPAIEEPPRRERAITSEILLPQNEALPFQQSPEGWDTNTQDLEDTPGAGSAHETQPPPPMAGSDLPFGAMPKAPAPPAFVSAGVAEAAGGELDPVTNRGPSALARKKLAPRGVAGPVPDIGPTPSPDLPPKPEPAQPVTNGSGAPTGPVAIAIPALGGRSGGLGVVSAPRVDTSKSMLDAETTTDHGSSLTPRSEPPPTEAPKTEPPATEATPEPMREDLDLEEAAAVRAELTMRGAVKSEVLFKHRLEDATWVKVERQHLKAIDEKAQESDMSLLDRYDDAYVEAQNRLFQAPIGEIEFARLQVAKETGRLANLLEELGLSRADLMRLERVWRRRQKADAELADRLEDEMERLRKEG
ncbi:MAG: DUF2169 domain-containing protein [Polyangiaceae bacterium]|nr:DUF2169 domain-containing protein [Polyangiaceae bacterium]